MNRILHYPVTFQRVKTVQMEDEKEILSQELGLEEDISRNSVTGSVDVQRVSSHIRRFAIVYYIRLARRAFLGLKRSSPLFFYVRK